MPFLDYHTRDMSQSNSITLSTSQAVFTLVFSFFALILLNGYAQNLVADYRSNTWLVLVGVILGMGAVILSARGRVTLERDALELAGFVMVVLGVWLYFVLPSLPTLLPPTHSSDAVRHYLQVMFSFPEGKLVSWYPAAGAFVAATFAHWLNVDPLRVLHPTAASFIALSAGAVYGMTSALLPKRRASKLFALFAAAFLFVPWSYFAGIILGEQYFYAQAFAQFFVLAALWYTASYAERAHWIFAALIGAALLGVVAAYPILVPLPIALFALVVFAQIFVNRQGRRAIILLIVFIALMILAGVALERGGVLEFRTVNISTTGDVGEGGVATPSLETLGGLFFLLLAGVGVLLAWRDGVIGKTVLAFLLAWLLQLAAFFVVQRFLPISTYRVDKTFYILVFPLAMLAARAVARLFERVSPFIEASPRVMFGAWIAVIVIVSTSVIVWRSPQTFTLFTEDELQTALWAKQNLDTYKIAYLDPEPVRAYWLAFGIWRETLPNEWFQWIPAGSKLGPSTFDEWARDPTWHPQVLVRDGGAIDQSPLRVVHQTGTSAILERALPRVAPPAPSVPARWYFGTALKMLGYDLPRASFAPGETIMLTTYTESVYPPSATVGWRVELIDRAGNVVSKAERAPFNDKYPVQRWTADIVARDVWNLPFDARALPGVYELRMGLYRREDGEPLSAFQLSSEGVIQKQLFAAPLTRVKIPLPPPSADDMRAATRLNARVGDDFALAGYALETDRSSRTAQVMLYWQSIAKTDNDYTVFVHVLDASGKIIAQSDAQPANGTYPTLIWDAQELVKDTHSLAIPADARAPFALEIGMYDAATGKRLAVGNDDKIILNLGF